jgi:hypothetical protein
VCLFAVAERGIQTLKSGHNAIYVGSRRRVCRRHLYYGDIDSAPLLLHFRQQVDFSALHQVFDDAQLLEQQTDQSNGVIRGACQTDLSGGFSDPDTRGRPADQTFDNTLVT